jgi:hypothetical protein
METTTEQPTQQKIKLNPKKIVNFLIVPLAILGLITYFVFLNNSYKNLTGKFNKQTELVVNQNLLITNLNFKNSELSTVIKNYDQKFSFLQTNVAHLQQLTDNLKRSSEDKDIKIKLLEQVLRKENTILAAKLRENLKKEGFEFNSPIGSWPKGAETLMKISRENFKKKLDELNKIKEKEEPKKEEKSEEKPKKQGFFKNLFK